MTLKLNPLREVVRGQRLTVVDDSIVRGTTTKQIVALLRRAGAAEVHVRISAPPIYHPCFYGIDTQIETELIAATQSVEEIRAFIGADSLGYLSIGGVLAALDLPYEQFCFACFDGNYPVPVPYDARSRKFVLEEDLGPRDRGAARPARSGRDRRAWLTRAGRTSGPGSTSPPASGRSSSSGTPSSRPAGPRSSAGSAASRRRSGCRPGMRDPLLVSATDGVGTKTAIASAARAVRHDRDRPRGDVRRRRRVQRRRAALLPRLRRGRPARPGRRRRPRRRDRGRLPRGRLRARRRRDGRAPRDHEGGRVRPGRLLRRRRRAGAGDRRLDDPRAGDAIVGLAATGLHANGFSLVRALLAQYDLDLRSPYQERLRRSLGDAATDVVLGAEPGVALATLGEVLLTPTRVYAGAILRLRTALERAGHDLRGIAHITGGGLPGNVPRTLPPGLAARLDPDRWPMPSVMRLFGALGGLEDDELRATFNGGLGMVVVVAPAAVDATIARLASEGIPAWRVGEVVTVEAAAGRRYAEGPVR